MSKTILITTAIPYINAEAHLGHLFEFISADVLKNFYQAQGQPVFFLTGVDEHGAKVAQAAKVAGFSPQAFADKMAKSFQLVCQQFDINYDYFVRTSDPKHIDFVRERWQRLKKAGLLTKKKYQGWYCTGCESFKSNQEIVEGRCPIHHQLLEKVEEENYFFQLEKFTDQIMAWIEDAVYPSSRRQEIINVLKSGALTEVSVSRPKSADSWGIEVPGDSSQVIYVWLDALYNYLSGLKLSGRRIDELWPADIQIIGKDIVKFHAIVWPALLLAEGLALPRRLLIHGFINVEGRKLSKSAGSLVYPRELFDRYGVEASRYLLFRQLNFYEDSNFVWLEFDAIYNGELAHRLGNLVSRIIGIGRKLGGLNLPSRQQNKSELDEFDFRLQLDRANDLLKQADRVITQKQLWIDPVYKAEDVRYSVVRLLEAIDLLKPFMPKTVKKILDQLIKLDQTPIFPKLTREE